MLSLKFQHFFTSLLWHYGKWLSRCVLVFSSHQILLLSVTSDHLISKVSLTVVTS